MSIKKRKLTLIQTTQRANQIPLGCKYKEQNNDTLNVY